MKKRDIILIFALILVSVAFLIPVWAQDTSGDAYIYVKGQLYGRYGLSEDKVITIDDGNGLVNNIEISGNEIFMRDATCPGKVCVKSGRISRNKESICCAPAGILIVIRSDEDTGYDAITQ